MDYWLIPHMWRIIDWLLSCDGLLTDSSHVTDYWLIPLMWRIINWFLSCDGLLNQTWRLSGIFHKRENMSHIVTQNDATQQHASMYASQGRFKYICRCCRYIFIWLFSIIYINAISISYYWLAQLVSGHDLDVLLWSSLLHVLILSYCWGWGFTFGLGSKHFGHFNVYYTSCTYSMCII